MLPTTRKLVEQTITALLAELFGAQTLPEEFARMSDQDLELRLDALVSYARAVDPKSQMAITFMKTPTPQPVANNLSIADQIQVRSKSEPSVMHTTTLYNDGSRACTCKGFVNHGYCLHLNML